MIESKYYRNEKGDLIKDRNDISYSTLIDPKIYKILRLFLDNKKNTFHLNIISQQTNVPIASTFRIVNRLIRYDIVSVIKKGKLNVYRFNKLDEASLIKLIDPKTYKILRLFLDNKEELFHLYKISSRVKVPIASTFRIAKRLIRLNIINIIQVGKFKLYQSI